MNGKFQASLIKIAAIILTVAIFIFSTSAQKSQPKPTVSPTPKPTIIFYPETKPTPRPTVSPLPVITPIPTVLPTPQPSPQNLSELQSRIRSIISRPTLERGRIGVKIVSLDTGKTIFEENGEKYFMPASNMKNFTVAAALEKLTPDFRFVTSVYAPTAPDASGTIRGDLIIYGRGDPSISISFNEKDYYKGVQNLVDRIAAAGIKRIEGNLIGDESYFSSGAIPDTWEWDDLQWYHGAEVSALTINDNALDVFVRPSTIVGAAASVELLPVGSGAILVNKVVTGAPGSERKIGIHRSLGSNIVEVFGSIPKDAKLYGNQVSVPKPALAFISMMRQLLIQKGIAVTGQTQTVDAAFRKNSPLPTNLVEVAKLESPPLALIAQKTMKPSQNLFTELILRALGEAVGDKTGTEKTSAERGIGVVQKFTEEIGSTSQSIVMWDGSGLSRHNLVTPNAVAQIYTYMNRSRFSQAWRDSLTIAGIDGTLKNRAVLKGTRAENNVRGKTGTIDQVSSLSGYLTTFAGEKVAFSIITNNIPDGRLRTSTIDEIVVLLANFNAKTN